MKSGDERVVQFKLRPSFISSIFNGQTVFSLFDHKKEYLNKMQRLIKAYFEDISNKHLEKKETAMIRQLHKVLTFANEEFLPREVNSTREREVDVDKN